MRILRKKLGSLFAFALAASLLSSCATVKISDREVCADAGRFGASCFNTLSDKQRDLSKAQWDKIRFGQFCMSSDAFTEWKIVVETLCEETGRCDYQTETKVQKFLDNVYKRKSKIVHKSGGSP